VITKPIIADRSSHPDSVNRTFLPGANRTFSFGSDTTLFYGGSDDNLAFAPKKVDLNGKPPARLVGLRLPSNHWKSTFNAGTSVTHRPDFPCQAQW
jgi:hypothetical protein